MGNKKTSYSINLMSLIVMIFFIAIVGIAITMSRYRSLGQSTLNADIAFYVVKDEYQEENVSLQNLYPSEETFDYQFTVSNSDGTNTAETSIDYTADLVITTNLPLEFKVYKNDNELTKIEDIENNVTKDSTGNTYIRKIKIKNGSFTHSQAKTDTYKLEVEFPIEYAQNEKLQGIIDNINIAIDAKQKIN